VIIHSFGVSSESILAPLFGILYETVVAFLHAFRPVAVSSPPPLLDAAAELPVALLIGSSSRGVVGYVVLSKCRCRFLSLGKPDVR
jgi:hypothetical protein